MLHNKCPLRVLFKHKPNYSFLTVFECSCFPCLRPYSKHKHDAHSIPYIFLGYIPRQKGYKFLSQYEKLYVNSDAFFVEYSFPFAVKTTCSNVYIGSTLFRIVLPIVNKGMALLVSQKLIFNLLNTSFASLPSSLGSQSQGQSNS